MTELFGFAEQVKKALDFAQCKIKKRGRLSGLSLFSVKCQEKNQNFLEKIRSDVGEIFDPQNDPQRGLDPLPDPQLLLKFDPICGNLRKRKNPQSQRLRAFSMELLPRFELGTSSLPSRKT